ncbi:MAG: hypothetical protein LBD51_07185, partial [Bifidobacteriaceae bacterium]|nr:hypothetical protein [Bifidobacteriaceae bacterium]
MHFTLQTAGGAARDYWAEDGATLRQVLADLELEAGPAPAGAWSQPLDQPVPPGALVVAAGGPAAAPAGAEPSAGGWRLVALGGSRAGAELGLRAPGGPVRAGATKRGRVRLSRLPGAPGGPVPGPVWLGRVRRRAGRWSVSWRRLRRPRRVGANVLIRTADNLFVLVREPLAGGGEAAEQAPRRPWRASAATAAAGLAMAGVMFLMTRNPVWALMPLIGVVASVGPMLARRPRPPWLEGVIGLDPAAAAPLAPGGVWELLGPPLAVAALARRLIAAALPPGAGMPALAVPPAEGWQWARFAPAPAARGADLAVELVERGLRLRLGQAWPAAPGGASRPAPARPEPRPEPRPEVVRLAVREAGLGIIAARGPGGQSLTAAGLAPDPLEDLARAAAAAGARRPASAYPATAEAVGEAWAKGALPPLGTAWDGRQVKLNLAQDGPHALVAGTSGSGKSEFLRALMLAEAVSTPPDRLAIVGLDHKGGATFRDLERLPHVVGVATDLDAAGTARVLTSLEAELAGRERLLERHQVAAWGELAPAARPARLLVVVDEFRTLLDALPEASARLERLAAQGRSLGMGLVLATQRPSGAVSAQLRANLALRVCFRVAGEADSLDVLGSAEAARIDPDQPGACVVATAGRPALAMRVSLAPPPPRRPARVARWPGAWAEPPAQAPAPGALIKAVAEAAAAIGAKAPPPPWRPALPARLEAAALAPASPGAITLGLADLPRSQTQTELAWDPASGHLAILGAPKSGRTQAAVTAAAGLVAAGVVTHVITHQPAAFARLAGWPALGGVVEAKDAERVGELLGALGGGPHGIVADGAAELEDLVVGTAGRPLVEALAQGSLAPGASLVLTGAPRPGRWLGFCPQRLILPVASLTEDLALGVPRELAGTRHTPGRACFLGGPAPLVAQVALAGSLAGWPGRGELLRPPARAAPLPRRVAAGDLPPSGPGWPLWLGLGGQLGTPLGLPLRDGRPVAVIGPHGSGRSTALDRIGRRAAAQGRQVLVAGRRPGRE